VYSVCEPAFRKKVSPPSSGSIISRARNQRVAGEKMEIIRFSETSIHIRTTWRYVPEDNITAAARTSNTTRLSFVFLFFPRPCSQFVQCIETQHRAVRHKPTDVLESLLHHIQCRRVSQKRYQHWTGLRQQDRLHLADFLLALLFDPEDRGNTFLGNVCGLVPDSTALHSRRVTAARTSNSISKHVHVTSLLFSYVEVYKS
jgi:hypothetical protein